MQLIEELQIEKWDEPISQDEQMRAITNLEQGKVLYFPSLAFPLEQTEKPFLSPDKVDPKRKNISFDLKTDRLRGTLFTGEELERLKGMLKRYTLLSNQFLEKLFPHYLPHLSVAKTSFRPVEIAGRKSSVRKDDMRLHIDAFPSNPTRGKRILRMFTNINPEGKPRIWKIGQPFEEVVGQFACKLPAPILGSSALLKFLKITKEKRSAYDHYMLHMHNKMKEDNSYQMSAAQTEFHFPPGSSWIVFTDQVSHAALSGQHVLEQTFSLPSYSLKGISTSPLKVLEKFFNRPLI